MYEDSLDAAISSCPTVWVFIFQGDIVPLKRMCDRNLGKPREITSDVNGSDAFLRSMVVHGRHKIVQLGP